MCFLLYVPISFNLVSSDIGYLDTQLEYSDEQGFARSVFNISQADLADITDNEVPVSIQVFVSDDEEAGFFMWLEDTGLDSKLSDKNYGELRKQYMEAVGGNAFMQSKKYLGNQMRDLFF